MLSHRIGFLTRDYNAAVMNNLNKHAVMGRQKKKDMRCQRSGAMTLNALKF